MLLPLLATPALVPVIAVATAGATVTDYRDPAQQQIAREQLDMIRRLPYRPREIAEQFSHGIDSHLPHGISTRVQPSRYVKDEVCQLVIDRVPGISDEQFQHFREMLRDYAPHTVAYSLDDITGYTGVEPPVTINLDTTARIFVPARRNWTPAEEPVVDEKVKELLAGKDPVCVQVAESDYACNPTLAMKRAPNGVWSDKRFCINFIPINRHTELDRYGSHKTETMLQRVVKGRYLTALDLRSGFHQIPVHPDHVCKTAFWWATSGQPPQLVAYKRMPFGLKNASAKFQRVMDAELARFNCTDFAFAYIDDLIIVSETWEEHVRHVKQVLHMLKSCNLKIHPEKSVFATDIVEYLGHNIIGSHGIAMNESKVEAIKALPEPKNVPDLRSILGFLSYYRHFIPGFSALTAPMNKLLKKGEPYVWGIDQREAYAELRRLMTTPGLVLRAPDPNRPYILHTDWSNYGIGAVLGQLDDEGREYLIACNSRSLNKHEANYPSYKGELLALTWAVFCFRRYIHGTKFKLVTDHQPLTWLMRARDLNGQYSRWQMMLQEYDFDVVHRPGVKHTNADVLSRFPRESSDDETGARLDHEEAVAAAAVAVQQAPQQTAGIDSFAPKFKDLFHLKVPYIDRDHYMDAAMRDGVEDDDPLLDESAVYREAICAAATEALSLSYEEISQYLERAARTAVQGGRRLKAANAPAGGQEIDTRVVGPSFFRNSRQGICLLELCGGICATLEACLKAGIVVQRYFYVDIDPAARQVARFKLHNLSARYPHLLSPHAWQHAFRLPQDIRRVTETELAQHGLLTQGGQWLLAAGWPCQDYSAAGHGQQGGRAALLDDVTRIIRTMQRVHKDRPIAYLLENVAMQANFRHSKVREEVYADLVKRIGSPFTFDAAQAGSHAHRLRNYWSNLVDPACAQSVLDCFQRPHGQILQEIVGPDYELVPVKEGERSISDRHYNLPGQPRVVFPTLMAFPFSRAFRPGRAGSMLNVHSSLYEEPSAEHREVIMGYEPSSTAAPGVTQRQRRALLGQAIDLNALQAILAASKRLSATNCAAVAAALWVPEAGAKTPYPVLSPSQLAQDSTEEDVVISPIAGSEPVDIWEDQATMAFLQQGTVPALQQEAVRVRKRASSFHWENNKLMRVISSPTTGAPVMRLVPHPDSRVALIADTHRELGHVGEKRTMYALSTIYWWQGLTIDVRRVLSACVVCQRVRATVAADQQVMQTEPHDFGMFYKWGLDFAGPFLPSALGNTYVLIMVDYYSKWIEAIPLKDAESQSVVDALLTLIARFGTPSEIITDNGPGFKGELEKFCAKRQINQRFITPGLPRSNGLAERAVQTVKRALKKHAAEVHHGLTWDTVGLSNILMGYRLTPQAASGFTPAQTIYAVDPAVSAEFYAGRNLSIDYDDVKAASAQLLQRARIAAQLEKQLTVHLHHAHERNAERFKRMRSGIYLPRVHQYRPGDYVFVFHPEDQVPGGALGIQARHDVLKVVEAQDSGVLVLENRAGERLTRHKEVCAPCPIPNIEGTTHPDMLKPSRSKACERCGDHRKGSKMLLCDHCNAGWHTFCLQPPLAEVPEGAWVCPNCLDAGVTLESIEERQARFFPGEVSRPNLELPSRRARQRAQQLMDQWHGAVVRHNGLIARVTYLGMLKERWFRMDYQDGSHAEYTTRVLPHLERLEEAEAPATLTPPPDPVSIYAAVGTATVNWSILRAVDVLERLRQLMPGDHSREDAHQIWVSLTRKRRSQLSPAVKPLAVELLLSVLDFRALRIVLDPWANTKAVEQGLKDTDSIIVTNDRLGRCQLQHEPLEPFLYRKVRGAAGSIDAVVCLPPPLFADLAMVTALEFTRSVVCMYVPAGWVSQAHSARFAYLNRCMAEDRLLTISDSVNRTHCWVCVFQSPGELRAALRAGIDCSLRWIVVNSEPAA
jgi:RNase H-like domain found in reverse transcriptase/Reverse transcriptase (RNA-dependent DNA polymerase)/Integrase core domain/Integrase zinc binding domain/PHD-finger/C-5 cytosine-specific DNA methylase